MWCSLWSTVINCCTLRDVSSTMGTARGLSSFPCSWMLSNWICPFFSQESLGWRPNKVCKWGKWWEIIIQFSHGCDLPMSVIVEARELILKSELYHRHWSWNWFSDMMRSSKLTSDQIDRMSLMRQFETLRSLVVSSLFRLLMKANVPSYCWSSSSQKVSISLNFLYPDFFLNPRCL